MKQIQQYHFQNRFKIALFCAVFLHNLTSIGLASQGYYVGERTSLNSEKQINQSINTVLALGKELFTIASLNVGTSPSVAPKSVDPSYGGFFALGYNTGMWGLDGSFAINASRGAKMTNQTGGGGITFAYAPGMFETGQGELDLLKAAHKEIYATELKTENEPQFWGRLGFSVSTFRSPILIDSGINGQSTLRQLALTIDGNVVLSRSLVLSAGIATYGYSQDAGTYASELAAVSTSKEGTLIARTFRGLPTFSLSTDIAWQVTSWDTFIPKLQETLIAASKQWEIAGSLTWRRRITRQLYIGPTYEMSVTGPAVVSGLAFDLLYQF